VGIVCIPDSVKDIIHDTTEISDSFEELVIKSMAVFCIIVILILYNAGLYGSMYLCRTVYSNQISYSYTAIISPPV
jgi:hypothetical protein